MSRALLALGSNLGDRGATLDAAVTTIGDLSGTQVLARSTWHATRPVGGPPGQGEFLNGAALLETALEPAALRRELQEIEQRLGRESAERWAARALDIDLLLYDDRVIDEPELQVPHPRMSFRPFVLAPAAEVAADMVHPVLGVTIGALWHHLQHAEDVVVVCGGVLADRYLLLDGLLRKFSTPESALIPDLPNDPDPVSEGLREGLRIRNGMLVADTFEVSWFQSMMKQSQPVLALPKLQIFFNLPLESLSSRVEVFGTASDQASFDRLLNEPATPNAMARLFTGIPTLTLDPRSNPADLLIEAAAALEAVWPDLCRPPP